MNNKAIDILRLEEGCILKRLPCWQRSLRPGISAGRVEEARQCDVKKHIHISTLRERYSLENLFRKQHCFKSTPFSDLTCLTYFTYHALPNMVRVKSSCKSRWQRFRISWPYMGMTSTFPVLSHASTEHSFQFGFPRRCLCHGASVLQTVASYDFPVFAAFRPIKLGRKVSNIDGVRTAKLY